MDMFEQATRRKIRFPTPAGNLSVEDLWGLPFQSKREPSLNGIAVALHEKIKSTEVSFVEDTSEQDQDTQLAFDLVKHVILTRKTESKAKADAAKEAERKERIREMIARKEDAELAQMSKEELEALLK